MTIDDQAKLARQQNKQTFKCIQPCPKGHHLRYSANKLCVQCQIERTLTWRQENPEKYIHYQWTTRNCRATVEGYNRYPGDTNFT